MGKEARNPRRLALGRAGTYVVGTLLCAAMVLGIFMVAYPKRIAASTHVDGIDLSLLSTSEAKAKLQEWWTARSEQPLMLAGPSDKAEKVATTPAKLGIRLDAERTLSQLPRDSFGSWVNRTAGRETMSNAAYHVAFDFSSLDAQGLEQIVSATSPALAPARVTLDKEGNIVRTPEVSSMKLVRGDTEASLRDAITGGRVCKLAAEYGKKNIADAELDKITEVVSTFSTKFSSGDRSRSSNLKVAAEKLDGVVVMPGERFSFNSVVGERTQANGFSKAGVYFKGKHEIDYGGGVCQVSTTLFNAVVRANVKINVRNNHTFLVPYVPIGCDAAVAFGSYDFVFTNTLETPIAIDSTYEPGKLTFNLLGIKEKGLEVKLVPVVTETWTHDPLYVEDPLLKPGEEKVVEKGGKGFRAVTTKIVLRDGVEVSRETLFKSHYKGGPKIIARPPSEKPVTPPETIPPVIDPGLSTMRVDLPGRPSRLGR